MNNSGNELVSFVLKENKKENDMKNESGISKKMLVVQRND